MAKYKIAWMPGDGVGNDVMDAARIVLDKIKLDADYPHADIGWEFWKTEANPLPDRTIDLLKQCNCALFGAITSLPKEEAERELDPPAGHTRFRGDRPCGAMTPPYSISCVPRAWPWSFAGGRTRPRS